MVRKCRSSGQHSAVSLQLKPTGLEGCEPRRVRETVYSDSWELTAESWVYFALDAIFFTIASTSFRSLSFRFAEYRRIWLRKRTSSSERCGSPLWPFLLPSEKNCDNAKSIAPAIFASVSSEGMVWPFSTRDR